MESPDFLIENRDYYFQPGNSEKNGLASGLSIPPQESATTHCHALYTTTNYCNHRREKHNICCQMRGDAKNSHKNHMAWPCRSYFHRPAELLSFQEHVYEHYLRFWAHQDYSNILDLQERRKLAGIYRSSVHMFRWMPTLCRDSRDAVSYRELNFGKVGKFLRYFICKLIEKRLARLVKHMREFTAAGVKAIRAVQTVRDRTTVSINTRGIAMEPAPTVCMLFEIPNLVIRPPARGVSRLIPYHYIKPARGTGS